MRKYSIALLMLALTALSCGKETPAGEAPGTPSITRKVVLTATAPSVFKATVASTGVVSWAAGDRLGVYTSASAIRPFDIAWFSGASATFVADLPSGETPASVAVFPYSSFKSYDGTQVTVAYPSAYTYAEGAMLSPMAAVLSGGTLAFAHLGGLISVHCDDVPSDAASFRLTAAGKKITGNFIFTPGAGMSVSAEASASAGTVRVNFTPGTAERTFNIPVPAGTYSSITVGFYNADGGLIYDWTLLEDVTINAGDMFLREPSFATINGTPIDPDNTRVGLVTNADTGAGIAGVPVTDGYTYTTTDSHGVYQFVAHADARCVYPSVPAAYEVPLDPADGEPRFWKTGSKRNDWALKPRTGDWTNFSILSFSDVHFFNKGEDQTDESTKYNAVILTDINAYLDGLSDNKVIILNTGDLVTNYTHQLAATRAEFAKIKKGGITVPMFPTIGNHDFTNDDSRSSTLDCSVDWFPVYGPLQYSFNVGNAHIVCLDNLQYAGHNTGGYGKAMAYDKGITDAQWVWLQADLNTVADKAHTLLVLCVHAPVMNNDWTHAADLRGVLKTFGESHILSGHSHYNVHRQFNNPTWNGLSGGTSHEHLQNPLGSLWKSSLGNDGSPGSYHVFTVNGAAITRTLFKAIGSADASNQFRIYYGDASYHDPVADTHTETGYTPKSDATDGKVHFDWKTLWEQGADGDPSGKLIVHVYDGGTRGEDINVYLNEGGVRTPMTHSTLTHRDQCAFSFFWNSFDNTANWAQTYWQCKTQNWWYGPRPSSGDWKVEVEFVEPAGSRWYESSTIQTDYTGFAWYN